MQRSLVYKFLAMMVLIIFILITLMMISGIISQREHYRNDVIKDISSSWTGEQTIEGVFLVVPYKEIITKRDVVETNGREEIRLRSQTEQKYVYYYPKELNINGNVIPEERYRGIYKIPVYKADMTFKGHFEIPKQNGKTDYVSSKITWQKPYLAVGIGDIRGINRSLKMNVNEKDIELLPGSNLDFIQQGVHGFTELNYDQDQKINFSVDLKLNGMKSLSFLPSGEFTNVNLTSPWPHPSFIGRYLPNQREISENGFKASWENSFFSSNMGDHFQRCTTSSTSCSNFKNNHFGVSFVEGVDIYLQAERAIKYAILFVLLTFVAFFLFEILKKLRIHPIQYGLVGFALMLFYLLLISLSEHIAFMTAYLIASGASVSLLTFYVSYVLKGFKRGLGFGVILVGLYGALYMLLRSEDFSLLLGSLLLFVTMALIMVVTRHVNWYEIGDNIKSKKPQEKDDKTEQKGEDVENNEEIKQD